MLERLSPVERAAFLLHDVFDCEYSEIARIIDKTEPAVRQMIHRARERVRSDKTRFQPSDAERVGIVRKFAAAAFAGDQKTLLSLFADEVALTSDGGGKVHAARRTVYGSRRLTNLFTVVTRKGKGRLTAQLVTINGETGILEFVDGKPFAVSAFTIEEGKVTAIYRVMNPDKLRSFADVPQTFQADLLSQTNDIGRLS
jgi:RNA polymerase sigma-70 factor (ECF subfamily)